MPPRQAESAHNGPGIERITERIPQMPVQIIRTYGDPCLKATSEPVGEVDDKTRALIRDMADTLYEKSHHIGLAASQVGVNVRLFVMDIDWISGEDADHNLQVFLNPEITWESEEDEGATEGCLSLPGIEAEIFRPSSVRLRYQDEDGKFHERRMTDLEARCAQHEMDHLNGKLFVDRLPFVRRRLLAGKLSALKKRQRRSSSPA